MDAVDGRLPHAHDQGVAAGRGAENDVLRGKGHRLALHRPRVEGHVVAEEVGNQHLPRHEEHPEAAHAVPRPDLHDRFPRRQPETAQGRRPALAGERALYRHGARTVLEDREGRGVPLGGLLPGPKHRAGIVAFAPGGVHLSDRIPPAEHEGAAVVHHDGVAGECVGRVGLGDGDPARLLAQGFAEQGRVERADRVEEADRRVGRFGGACGRKGAQRHGQGHS